MHIKEVASLLSEIGKPKSKLTGSKIKVGDILNLSLVYSEVDRHGPHGFQLIRKDWKVIGFTGANPRNTIDPTVKEATVKGTHCMTCHLVSADGTPGYIWINQPAFLPVEREYQGYST
jgi:hypothetical protein